MKKLIYTAVFALLTIVGQQAWAQNAAGQNRQVSGFSSLASSGPFQVQVKLDDTESLRIDADEAILNEIETVVENDALLIRIRKGLNWNKSRDFGKVNVYVTAKTLKNLINSGSGSIKVDGTIQAEDFKAVLSGSGSITTNVKTKHLKAVLSGSGFINLSGRAEDADVVLSGSGQLAGKTLGTSTTSAVIAGSGQVYVAADKQVNARITGSGLVVYTGDAKVQSHSVGSGRVTKAN